MRALRVCVAAGMAIAFTLTASAQGQDDSVQVVTVHSWNFCSGAADGNCVAKEGSHTINTFTKDGTPTGSHDLSRTAFPSSHELNSDYNIIKLSEHGCANPSDKDDSCWVETRWVQIDYCVSGAVPSAGIGHAQTQEGTSMGSGKGCRQ